jgi:pantoate--beta-alanine ligase
MSLRVIHTIDDLRAALVPARRAGTTIGLVPTMGALHAGHARLIETARRECGMVVVSVFVNPIQFDEKDDYARYPRTLDTDARLCESLGVDLVFAPEAGEMYPEPLCTVVEVRRVSEHLCGRFRPGHFQGVATVVLKLFNIVQPGRAYFGEKDAQQLAVIRRMVRDLNLPLTIVGVPTVREPDGLALSSRNQRLSASERQVALSLSRALHLAQRLIREGATGAEAVKREALAALAAQPDLRVEYLEIVDPDEMQPVEEIRGPVRVAAAIRVGPTRLIDNVEATVQSQ